MESLKNFRESLNKLTKMPSGGSNGGSVEKETNSGSTTPTSSAAGAVSGNNTGRGRGTKRKVEQHESLAQKVKKSTKGELQTPELAPNAFPKEHPYNRDGYRYVLAEADPHAPFRQDFDEATDLAGKPIPGFLCRVLTPENVLLALHDRAPQVIVSEDRLSTVGHKFYCTIRANHYVNRGTWYYEAKIVDLPEGAATRIGWAQRNANLQAPLGFDKFGYSCRSRKGTKFHESIGKHYTDGYKEGDYIGCLIHMPEIEKHDYLPKPYKDKPLIKFKSHLYFEEKDRLQENLKNLKPLPGSKITYFKNGEPLGEAFTDIYMGDYTPSVATYKHAKVRFNFGPKFRHPPKNVKLRPMSARAEEASIDQTVADMRFFTEKQGKLRLDNYSMSP